MANSVFNRLFPSTVNYNSFKNYVLEVYNERRRREGDVAVNNIHFAHELYGHEIIRSDHDLRILVKKCLSQKDS